MSAGIAGASRDADVDEVLRRERVEVEAALDRSLERLDELLETDGATGEVADAVRYGVTGGGKRIRPILCVAAGRAVERSSHEGSVRDETSLYDLAVSLELIHAYSLMHDDLPCMDDAPLRRGRPSTHRAHGEEITVVAGALLIPAAALQAWRAAEALSLPEERRRRLVARLLEASGARGMVGGQALDLLGEERPLEEGEVRALHAMKTGALLSAAPAMGGLAAGAADDVVEALTAFGRELGLAFQIADDLLDATSSAETLGKEPSDRDLGKSTYVTRFGVEGARRRARERVDAARSALAEGGVSDTFLEGLAEYVVRRRA